MLATHFPEKRTRVMRIGAVAIACIAMFAVVTLVFSSSGEPDVSLASSSSVQLCSDINFGGTCKPIGYGRCSFKLQHARPPKLPHALHAGTHP